jgi:hypothetical protein
LILTSDYTQKLIPDEIGIMAGFRKVISGKGYERPF